MRTIIIGASKNNKIGSGLIRWWIKAPYSHVYARWYLNEQDRDIVYQASHGLVHFREYNNFKKENSVVKEIKLELSDEQFKRFSQKCIDLAAEPYSKVQLFLIFIYELLGKDVKVENQPGYICSELMAELLTDLGFKFEKPLYLINPKDIISKLEGI